MNWTYFLLENAQTEEQLTHLEHAEDHLINAGEDGFNHAFNTLHNVHQALLGKKHDAKLTTKYDGSPSIVAGYHPETKRFFVASKSVFNKNPKINYTPADIEKNHGHAPGLVSKLKSALQHLPKVVPTSGIYQGDLMYTKADHDVKTQGSNYHFTPNTITYSVNKNSDHGKQIAKAKMGVAFHTRYVGDDITKMKAVHGVGHEGFNQHDDVHLIDVHTNLKNIKYTPDAAKNFTSSMQKAMKAHVALKDYDHLEPHRDYMKMYINKSVEGTDRPSASGYKSFIQDRFTNEAAKLVTDAGKQRKLNALQHLTSHLDQHHDKIESTFDIHHHLQNAKNVLVHTLAQDQEFHHSVDGVAVKPEGHVAVINNRPTKLVDRSEFSKMNRLRTR